MAGEPARAGDEGEVGDLGGKEEGGVGCVDVEDGEEGGGEDLVVEGGVELE